MARRRKSSKSNVIGLLPTLVLTILPTLLGLNVHVLWVHLNAPCVGTGIGILES